MKFVSAALVVLSISTIAPSMANGNGTVRRAKADKCNSFSETVSDLLEQLEDIDIGTGAEAGSSAIEAPAEAKDMGIGVTKKAAQFLLHATKAAVASVVESGIIGDNLTIYTIKATGMVALTDETKEEKALLVASLLKMASAHKYPAKIGIIELFQANLGLDDKELDDFLLSLGGYMPSY